MFLLPDGDKWLDPRTGKHAELAGMSCDPLHECLQVTETGYKKHPLPKAVHLGSGAKRGQLTAKIDPRQRSRWSESLRHERQVHDGAAGPQQITSTHGYLPVAVGLTTNYVETPAGAE